MFDIREALDDARGRALLALDDAPVVRDGPANLQRGWQAVGGWLALSPNWLAFYPHRVNWRPGRVLLPASRIRQVRACWTRLGGLLPIVPNAVEVVTVGRQTFRFTVLGRQEWVGAIRLMAEA